MTLRGTPKINSVITDQVDVLEDIFGDNVQIAEF